MKRMLILVALGVAALGCVKGGPTGLVPAPQATLTVGAPVSSKASAPKRSPERSVGVCRG